MDWHAIYGGAGRIDEGLDTQEQNSHPGKTRLSLADHKAANTMHSP
jgi:hypothetical protein